MELRNYQIAAVDALLTNNRGILQAPAGSGKTIIAAAALAKWVFRERMLLNRKITVGWVANTREQVEQAWAAIECFPQISTFATIKIQCYAGCETVKPYDILIMDECHHVPAPEFRKLLEHHTGARWGLSATPDREDEAKGDVFKLIGPIIHTVDRADLVASNQLARARVIVHHPNSHGEHNQEVQSLANQEYYLRKVKWPFLFRTAMGAKEQMSRIIYQFAVEVGIITNESRNKKIIALAHEHSADSTLILVGRIEHGHALASQIPGAEVVFSKMGAKKRRDAISRFASGALKCMIATSLADEGLDVPRASVLIQVAAGRSAAKAEQRTGRVLRAFSDATHHAEKTHGTIHDFGDTNHTYLAAQARRRIAVYRGLGYEIFNQPL